VIDVPLTASTWPPTNIRTLPPAPPPGRTPPVLPGAPNEGAAGADGRLAAADGAEDGPWRRIRATPAPAASATTATTARASVRRPGMPPPPRAGGGGIPGHDGPA
jgi:hypothetical protein